MDEQQVAQGPHDIIVVPVREDEPELSSRDRQLRDIQVSLVRLRETVKAESLRMARMEARLAVIGEMIEQMYHCAPHGPGYQFALGQFEEHLRETSS